MTDSELATKIAALRRLCADFDALLVRMREGEAVAVSWDGIADARTKLRLAEREQAKRREGKP